MSGRREDWNAVHDDASGSRDVRVRELFLAARELDELKRADFLARVSKDDPPLAQEVRDLLKLGDADTRFLESPVMGRGFLESVCAYPEDQRVERIGAYRVERLIGEGGFARVYAAQQESPVRRRVAIKLLKAGVATQDVIRRFEAERQHMASMDHPAIARIFDAGATGDGRPFVVMEYIDGRPITTYCEEHKIGHRGRVEFVRQACEAVQHAHSKGVIHRDLKPSNILVSGPPDLACIKIIDFGVAKAIHESSPDQTVRTYTGQILGTLPYASPEQLGLAGQAVDTRSDVYALGVVLYELLAGKLPHDVRHASILEAVQRVTLNTPASLGSVDTTLRGDLETIVAKAIRHNPDDRYQSASELAADLGRYLHGDAVLARPPSLSYQLRKLSSRHKGATAGMLMTVFVTVAAFFWIVGAERRAQHDYRAARDTAHFLLSRVIDDLGNTVGTLELRQELVDNVLPFVEQHQNDPEIARDYARALWVASDQALEKGKVAAGLADRRMALRVLEKLAADSHDDLDLRASISIAIVKIGDCHKAMGEYSPMKSLYLRALEIDEWLVAQDPGSRHYRSNLAWSYQRLGALAARDNDLPGTLAYFARWTKLTEDMLAENPNEHTTVYGSYEFEGIIASLYWAEADFEAVATHTQKAWEHLGRAFVLAPDNRRYVEALPEAFAQLASLSNYEGDWTESSRLMDEAVIRLENIARLEPQSDVIRQRLANVHSARAGVALSAGDNEVAAAQLAAANDLLEQALIQPNPHVFWHDLHVRVLYAQHDLAVARGLVDHAAEYRRRICEICGDHVAGAEAEAWALLGYAHCLANPPIGGVADLDLALRFAQRADEVAGGHNSDTLKLIAEIYLMRGEPAAALAAISRAREVVGAHTPLRRQLDELAAQAEEIEAATATASP